MEEPSGRIRVQPVAPAAWIQLGVLVNDGSGSMTWPHAEQEASREGGQTKGQAVDAAVTGLIERLKTSRKASNFCLSCIAFNDRVTDRQPPRRVSEISTEQSFDPTDHGIGTTAIHRGLGAAAELVNEFLREGAAREVPSSAVVVLLSDGEETDDADRTREVARQIQAIPNVDLAACLFATQGMPPDGEALLEEVVSHPRLYKRVHTVEEMRDFFLKSVTAGRLQLPPGEA